jgi:ubiquinone/menaquinone biosynthesis C-methylase UbiE
MSIAEIGLGAGDVVLEICRAIGPAGHLFAIAPAPEEAARVRDTARDCGNVHIIESQPNATSIGEGSCDRVLMANVWAELPDGRAALREARRLLRDEGRLVVVEWQAHARHGDAPELRVGMRDMVRLLENEVWDIHAHGDLGSHCYFLEAGISDESVQS